MGEREGGATIALTVDPDGDEPRGKVRSDPRHRRLVNVLGPEDRWLLGTPFAVMTAADLRAWATVFTRAAEALDARD